MESEAYALLQPRLFPRDGKCQHAFCIDVDRAGDIRVLANVVPTQQWMDTMLHELGHATFDAGLDPRCRGSSAIRISSSPRASRF